MPVLVTVTAPGLAETVVRSLVATGGQVRAFCGPEAPVGEIRGAGAIVASGSLLDEGHLETAMEQVHTVVHLGIRPLVGSGDLVLEEAATVVSAAVGAGIRRMIVLSLPGAGPEAGDAVRRAAHEVEIMAADAPFPATAVRASLVDTGELRHALARTALDSATLDNAVAPVRADDLAELITWLDDRRQALAGAETLAADGPRVVPLRDYLRSVGVTPMSAVGRIVERLRPGDSDAFEGVLAGPLVSGGGLPDGWSRAGIAPRWIA